jgi:hypothetical protein
VNIYNKEIVVMAVIKKTLFAENLDRYQTLVTDTNPTSDYFKITELPDTFTGGKNAFLIQGSDYLVPDTLIKIEIKDSKGNIIYHEPGEGIVSSSVDGAEVVTEYYEGVSKVVAVHIYPDTAFGPATITILGELSSYNSNGLNSPIPLEWEGKYNVKWQRQINVNPSLANTTKIRFYRRPTANIVETLSPIYTIVSGSKIESNIVSSFANITLSKLDTFAGDVKRIKVYRTSEGDISDYDMIQDILLESKELLTSYNLTGSVIGEAGLMTSEVLEKLWSYPTLTTQLTSSRVDNGVKLNGNGYFRYTSSLQLSANSVYEFGIDAFYSASTNSDMGIYVSGSNNGEVLVGTLNGVAPTKNLKDTILQFTLPFDEPTASLYLSQSQSEWHIGNLSVKLTEDTAFSPSEISFVTSMPTVVGNETYNFKFEFYDVNNNYVPVLVTQSALFTGGNNNIGGTLIFISASASSSLAQLNAVSSSISGTATLYSSSANTTIVTLSGSVSGSIVTLSGSVSGSITSLSSSVSSSITSLSSSVSQSNAIILSSSFAQVKNLADGRYSGSFIGDTVIYSPTIGGQQGYIKDLFTVGDNTSAQINLDARTTNRRIYIGTGDYNNTNTSIYLDGAGKFSLKDKLTFDGTTLSVNGTINVTGGNAATQTYANTIGTNAVSSGSVSAAAAQAAAELFASSAAGRAVTSGSNAATAAQTAAINQAKTDASASINLLANGNWTAGSGTFITANSISSPIIAGNGGYISGLFVVGNGGAITLDGTNKKMYIGSGTFGNANTSFYVDNSGQFSLKDKLTWNGTTLSISGDINVTGGNAATTTQVSAAQTAADNAQTTANGKLSAGQAANDVNSNSTTISGGKIRTGIIESTGYSYSSGDYSTTGTQINLDNGLIRSKNFVITSAGDALFKGSIAIGSSNSIFKADTNGIYLGNETFSSAPFRVTPAGSLSATNANLTGNITATGGTLGGWVIDGAILRDSASRLQLNPGSPSVDMFDTSGAKRLTVKFGSMTSPWSAANVTMNPPSVFINPPGNVYGVGFHTETVRSSNYSEFYVSEAGTYFAQSYTSAVVYNAITTGPAFQGYASAAARSVITDTSGNEVTYLGGTYGDTSSANTTVNLNGYTSGVYVSFPLAGTYRIYVEYSFDLYIQQGTASINSISVDDPQITTAIQLNIAEVTTDGFQVISSAESYCRIQRGSNYAIEAKGSIDIEAPSGNFIYLDGLVHPMTGNKNDLGTTGNRWKTVWTNNALNSTSDRRLKHDIEDTDLGLDFVNKLRPVKYKNNWSESPRYHYGLIAQELTSSLAEIGKTTSDVGFIASASFQYTEEDIEKWKTQPDWKAYESEISSSIMGELGLSYTELISPMIKAIQQLSDKVTELEAKISGSI